MNFKTKQLNVVAISAVLASAAVTFSANAEEAAVPKFDEATEQVIRNGYIRNAAIAQMHRQWTYYENDAVDVASLMDTMSDDVAVTTPAGATEGADAFKEFVTGSTPNYANGHNLQSADVGVDANGDIVMQVSADYVSAPTEENPQASARVLNFATKLGQLPVATLPKFTEIIISAGDARDVEPLTNAYANNRVRSLVHYYNSLVENPARDAQPFAELFADEFNIDFGGGEPITQFSEFEKWVAGPASSVAASTHTIDSLSVEEVGDNEYKVAVDFSWKGILPNGMGMAGKTHHDWVVVDDPAERFARIKDVKVSFIEPIGPISN